MNMYIHGRTSVYNINYHIVWCVKYRRKVLTPQRSERLYEHPEMKEESVRTIECDCGLIMSRDQNAAINIKKERLRILKSVA